MGLGKSLSLLALVCSSLDSLASQKGSPNDGISRATLIVTPKSSISQIFVISIDVANYCQQSLGGSNKSKGTDLKHISIYLARF